MRITLLGVLGFLAVAVLLIYAGYELHRTTEEEKEAPPKPPNPPPVNP
jgi:hypothetical protein